MQWHGAQCTPHASPEDQRRRTNPICGLLAPKTRMATPNKPNRRALGEDPKCQDRKPTLMQCHGVRCTAYAAAERQRRQTKPICGVLGPRTALGSGEEPSLVRSSVRPGRAKPGNGKSQPEKAVSVRRYRVHGTAHAPPEDHRRQTKPICGVFRLRKEVWARNRPNRPAASGRCSKPRSVDTADFGGAGHLG